MSLTTQEKIAIGLWAGAIGCVDGIYNDMEGDELGADEGAVADLLPDYENESNSYMPLFERLADYTQENAEHVGMRLWLASGLWRCGYECNGHGLDGRLPHGEGHTPGEAICRAVLAWIEASTLDKKAKP